MGVLGYNQNKECHGRTQTRRGSQSFLGSNLSQLDFVDGAVAGKLRLILEILKTSVRNFKTQRFRNVLEYFYFPQVSRDPCMFEAKQNSCLAMSKVIQLFQPSYVLALVIPQAHSSTAGCYPTAIKTIPKLMKLSVTHLHFPQRCLRVSSTSVFLFFRLLSSVNFDFRSIFSPIFMHLYLSYPPLASFTVSEAQQALPRCSSVLFRFLH